MSDFKLASGGTLNIGKSIAKGGEGEVFSLDGVYNNMCLKVYFPHLRTADKENKLKYMCANPPANISNDKFRICWPQELVYDNDGFVGFIMPKAFEESQAPYHLCLPAIPEKLGRRWKSTFDRKSSQGQLNRMMLCVNISAAVALIHEAVHYVLVDLKPQNLLVTPNGKVSLIDMDSIQVSYGGQVVFKAPVSTPEYTPPEAKAILKKGMPIDKSWDSFSLGIIIYEILCGIHPYVGTCKPPHDQLSTISEKINEGLTHITKGKTAFQVLPAPHENFRVLSKNMRQLFICLFKTDKNAANNRPTIKDIGKCIFDEITHYKENEEKIKIQKKMQEYDQLVIAVQRLENDIRSKENKLVKEQESNKKLREQLLKAENETSPWAVFLGIALAIVSFIFLVTYQTQESKIKNYRSRESSTFQQNQVSEEHTQLKNTVKDLQTQLTLTETRNDQLNRDLQESQKLAKSDKGDEYKRRFIQLNSDYKHLKNENNQLKSSNNKLKIQLSKVDSEKKHLQSELQKKKTQLSDNPKQQSIKTYTTTKSKGILRSMPDAISNKLRKISANETVAIIGKYGSYWYVFYKGQRGYINEMYLNMTKEMKRM